MENLSIKERLRLYKESKATSKLEKSESGPKLTAPSSLSSSAAFQTSKTSSFSHHPDTLRPTPSRSSVRLSTGTLTSSVVRHESFPTPCSLATRASSKVMATGSTMKTPASLMSRRASVSTVSNLSTRSKPRHAEPPPPPPSSSSSSSSCGLEKQNSLASNLPNPSSVVTSAKLPSPEDTFILECELIQIGHKNWKLQTENELKVSKLSEELEELSRKKDQLDFTLAQLQRDISFLKLLKWNSQMTEEFLLMHQAETEMRGLYEQLEETILSLQLTLAVSVL